MCCATTALRRCLQRQRLCLGTAMTPMQLSWMSSSRPWGARQGRSTTSAPSCARSWRPRGASSRRRPPMPARCQRRRSPTPPRMSSCSNSWSASRNRAAPWKSSIAWCSSSLASRRHIRQSEASPATTEVPPRQEPKGSQLRSLRRQCPRSRSALWNSRSLLPRCSGTWVCSPPSSARSATMQPMRSKTASRLPLARYTGA
mmetsp:Transcript_69165/g.192547  ORF Transcript_69165/g.192547 Transcript_69165/m.192547 type:complete len:201 (-) Transcript_69165:204-806(-)